MPILVASSLNMAIFSPEVEHQPYRLGHLGVFSEESLIEFVSSLAVIAFLLFDYSEIGEI